MRLKAVMYDRNGVAVYPPRKASPGHYWVYLESDDSDEWVEVVGDLLEIDYVAPTSTRENIMVKNPEWTLSIKGYDDSKD